MIRTDPLSVSRPWRLLACAYEMQQGRMFPIPHILALVPETLRLLEGERDTDAMGDYGRYKLREMTRLLQPTLTRLTQLTPPPA